MIVQVDWCLPWCCPQGGVRGGGGEERRARRGGGWGCSGNREGAKPRAENASRGKSEKEPGGGESRLARGGPRPGKGMCLAAHSWGRCVGGLGVAPDGSKQKGKKKGNRVCFLQQECEPRLLILKTRPRKCCPSVLRRQLHPGFRGCVDSRANSGFLWNAVTSGCT